MAIIFLQELICRLGTIAYIRSQPKIRGEIFNRAYEKVQKYPTTFFQNTPSGTIINQIRALVSGYEILWEDFWYKLTNPILQSTAGLCALLYIQPILGLFMIFWLMIAFPILQKMAKKLSVYADQKAEKIHIQTGFLSDNIINMFSTFSFAKEKAEAQRLRNFTENEVVFSDKKMGWFDFKFMVTSGTLYCLMMFFMLSATIYLRIEGKISTGDVAFTLSIVHMILQNFWSFNGEFGRFFTHLGDFKAAFKILEHKENNLDKKDALELVV